MMRLGHRRIGFQFRNQHIVGVRLLPCQVDIEGQQRDQSHDWNVVRRRTDFPKLSPIHKVSTNQAGKATIGRPVERRSTCTLTRSKILSNSASLDSRMRLPLQGPPHSPAAFGPRRGLSASSVSITGAGPEIPPSFLTRQKCTIIRTDATMGIPMQCQMYDRSNAFASTIDPPSNP